MRLPKRAWNTVPQSHNISFAPTTPSQHYNSISRPLSVTINTKRIRTPGATSQLQGSPHRHCCLRPLTSFLADKMLYLLQQLLTATRNITKHVQPRYSPNNKSSERIIILRQSYVVQIDAMGPTNTVCINSNPTAQQHTIHFTMQRLRHCSPQNLLTHLLCCK